uniref:SPOCK3 n=1 Tax=Varanus komodoensis TaxID=61221 RepID=A0A8D2J356_VARKO
MRKVAAFACVWAAAWCSQAVAAAAAAAAAAAGAGGRSDSGNFLDDKQWLTTISQYDKEVGQWNKFRDVSVCRARPPGSSDRFCLPHPQCCLPGSSLRP